MKLIAGLLLIAVIGCSNGFPANTESSESVEPVNIHTRIRTLCFPAPCQNDNTKDAAENWNFPGVVDTYGSFPFPLITPNFNNFESRLLNILRRINQQSIPTFDPTAEGNTTSTIEVINGHKVEVNTTVYDKNNDFGNLQMTLISLRNVDSDEDTTDLTTESSNTINDTYNGSPEVLEKENSKDNEINQNPDDQSTTEMHDITTIVPTQSDRDIADLVEKFVENNSESDEKLNAVNENTKIPTELEDLNQRTTIPMDVKTELPTTTQIPDVPFPPVHDKKDEISRESLEHERSEEFGDYFNYNNFEIDELNSNHVNDKLEAFESIPIDLSNDIAVNQIQADQGAPVNPDAEIFDPMQVPPHIASNQPFEYQPYYQRHREFYPRTQPIVNEKLYWPKK